ncbi:MAG: esterase [Candidatus Marinimicrobia bacterium]|nr:esterase [Candidatus Neomarinimicrobiota bacterium]
MNIWHTDYTAEEIGRIEATGLNSRIGIEITEVGDDYLKGTMPVDDRTKQPAGLLHGGANCVLAETLASWAATLVIDPSQNRAVGLEINANHIRSATEGEVTGVSRPIHIGRQTHVWEVKIKRQDGKLSCVSRVTMAIIEKQEEKT